MAKQISILTPLFSFIVEDIIARINEIPIEDDLDVLLNSPGGSVFAGWTVGSVLAERKGKVKIKVAGHAASMAPALLLFADSTEALDVTQFMLHRADMFVENDEEKELLAQINKDLFKKLSSKIDGFKLKEIKGVTLKEIFEGEERINVWLTAKEAKEIGLIDKVVKLERKSVTAYYGEEISAILKPVAEKVIEEKTPKVEIKDIVKPIKNKNPKKMDKKELMAQHPDLYNEIMQDGATLERDRIEAWTSFSTIDVKAVAEGIKSGEAITNKDFAAFAEKQISNNALKNAEKDSPKEINAAAEATDGKTPEMVAFEKGARKSIGLKEVKV